MESRPRLKSLYVCKVRQDLTPATPSAATPTQEIDENILVGFLRPRMHTLYLSHSPYYRANASCRNNL